MSTKGLDLESHRGRRTKPRRALTPVGAVGTRKKTTMRAAAIDRFGPPSVLKLHNVPVPKPKPNQVLIALYAAGVGVWDADIRGGWWPGRKPKFPLALGTDGA